jgi:Ca-activated chloride channel family protein
VADDVYMNVLFNPKLVKQYRLIGFDNKLGALADSNSIIEGGEIGSGQTMIAAFEIESAMGSMVASGMDQFAQVHLQYKNMNDTARKERKINIAYDPVPFKEVEPIYRFASSVIMFGSLLKNSVYARDYSWGDVIMLSSESANPTDINQHQFVELVMKGKANSGKFKKKRKE